MPIILAEERITDAVIRSFYEVYNNLGYGFLETIYVSALERELLSRHLTVGREVQVRIHYKSHEVGLHRLDMLVGEKVIVEVKSSLDLHRAAPRQVYNYLRATNLEVGLLLHFGMEPKFYRLFMHRSPQSVSGCSG